LEWYVPFNFIQQTYCILFLTNHKYDNTHVYAQVDSTNQIASNPPARKNRLFGSSTLDCFDLFFQKKQRAARWREKVSLELSPTLDRSQNILRQRYGEFEPANNRYHSITSLAAYKVPYNEYLVEISDSLACSRDYLYWVKLAVLGNI
jgi:hypothetical protein